MKKLLFLLFFAALWLHGAPQNQYTPDDFRRISAMLAKVLDKNHYSDVRMLDELSCRIFDTCATFSPFLCFLMVIFLFRMGLPHEWLSG